MSPLSNPSAVNPYTDAEAIAAVRDAGNALTLANLLKNSILLHVPTNAGWTETLVGSGTTEFEVAMLRVNTGATASSSGLLSSYIFGLTNQIPYGTGINWAKKIYIIFGCARYGSVATAISRFQLKSAATIGALAAKGIGIRVDNFALVGESYGTEIGEVSLATNLSSQVEAQIIIVHDPSVPEIKWYVNGVLKGTQSTAAKIPTSPANTYSFLVSSVINGATAAYASWLAPMRPKIWQAR